MNVRGRKLALVYLATDHLHVSAEGLHFSAFHFDLFNTGTVQQCYTDTIECQGDHYVLNDTEADGCVQVGISYFEGYNCTVLQQCLNGM